MNVLELAAGLVVIIGAKILARDFIINSSVDKRRAHRATQAEIFLSAKPQINIGCSKRQWSTRFPPNDECSILMDACLVAASSTCSYLRLERDSNPLLGILDEDLSVSSSASVHMEYGCERRRKGLSLALGRRAAAVSQKHAQVSDAGIHTENTEQCLRHLRAGVGSSESRLKDVIDRKASSWLLLRGFLPRSFRETGYCRGW